MFVVHLAQARLLGRVQEGPTFRSVDSTCTLSHTGNHHRPRRPAVRGLHSTWILGRLAEGSIVLARRILHSRSLLGTDSKEHHWENCAVSRQPKKSGKDGAGTLRPLMAPVVTGTRMLAPVVMGAPVMRRIVLSRRRRSPASAQSPRPCRSCSSPSSPTRSRSKRAMPSPCRRQRLW